MDAARFPVPPRRRVLWCAGIVAVLFLALAAVVHWRHGAGLRHELLALPPDDVTGRPALVRYALAEAQPLFAARCASCHGANGQGDVSNGAPSLTDGHWLYGAGRVSDIERTILFGIRAGNGRTRNLAEMPALGQAGLLQPAEMRNVVAFLQSLRNRNSDADAAAQGRATYAGKGHCGDCHGADAKGSTDLGAPDLVAGKYLHGGGAQELYESLFLGRHGVCPAWYGVLTLGEIRALAVFVHEAAASAPAAPAS